MRDTYLEEFYSFLRFASVSTDPAFAEKFARAPIGWSKTEQHRTRAQLIPTAGHPVVWAKNKHQPGRKTVLIYGHYDVQPPDPLEIWESPPFEPVLKNGYVFARGATDNKGQIFPTSSASRNCSSKMAICPSTCTSSSRAKKKSAAIICRSFCEQKRLRCDAMWRSFPIREWLRAVCRRLSYRTARRDGFGSEGERLENGFALRRFRRRGAKSDYCPRAIARDFARRQWTRRDRRILRQVKPLEDWEREAWRKLPIDADKEVSPRNRRAGALRRKRYGTRGANLGPADGGNKRHRRRLPGEGDENRDREQAMAKLTFRLVPNQEGAEILKLAHDAFEKHLPPGVKMEITDGHSGPWYLTDPHSKIGEAAQPRSAESFQQGCRGHSRRRKYSDRLAVPHILGVETLLMGLALPDCRAHSPNENFPLENLEGGMRLNKAVLQELAG